MIDRIMTEENLKKLSLDPDGLLTYEYMANHINDADIDMAKLVDNMIAVDSNGQFLVSASRYLAAIDHAAYKPLIDRVVATAIERDRERCYIGELLPSLWGDDYALRADELTADDNFCRIYKRIHPGVTGL